MTEIWKFPIPCNNGLHPTQMPAGARVLSAAYQGRDLQIWAIVDPNARLACRLFRVIGTGFTAHEPTGNFVGTAFEPMGLVWHVFDLGENI